MNDTREPYVGSGYDGALRSAWIDESEADGLDREDPRRADLLESAQRWRKQAATLAEAAKQPPEIATAEPGSLMAAAIRLDTDPSFRASVTGEVPLTAEDLSEDDWDAIASMPNPLLEEPRELGY